METNPLAVSDPAPAFVASDEQGHMHRLAEYQGATVVLCFLPSPLTDSPPPRDLAEAFPGWDLPDVFLLGVQRATPQQAGEFRSRHRVPFPIVADPDGRISAAYGIGEPAPGKPGLAFVAVGPDGRVRSVLKNRNSPRHVLELLRRAR